jgi:acetylornithine deacetylase/succinyl-diaminopimelate desuccinylase family protein
MALNRFVRKKELIDLTTRLIQIPTENPPGNEKNAFLFLNPILSKMGFKIKTLLSPKGRSNIIAEKRWGKGGRRLIFNGHLDVVPAGHLAQWKYPPFQGKLEKGRIYGRGASDMKGGISSFLHAISTIDRSNIHLDQGAVILHLVSDEESHGHQGMGFLTHKRAIQGDAVLVGEPTDLDLMIAQKGALWLRISTIGKSAHGSRPHSGVNAIEKMIRVIDQLNSISLEEEHSLLGKPTFNIGTIQGGTKVNIVPDQCEIEVDRRMLPTEEKEGVLRKIKESLDLLRLQDSSFQYHMEEIDFAEPSEIDPKDEIVKISMDAVGEVKGERPKIKGSSGFTDARFYIKQCHIPALILGPGGVDQPHTTNESVEVDALVQAAQIYGLMILRYLSGC